MTAAAVMMMSESKAQELRSADPGADPRFASVGVDPALMGIARLPCDRAAVWKKSGLAAG